MSQEEFPNNQMEDFEVVALNLEQYTRDQVKIAFRAGNKAFVTAVSSGGDQAMQAIQKWGGPDGPIERLGNDLVSPARRHVTNTGYWRQYKDQLAS